MDSYQIKLPIFEGPMDLLLHLIRENKLDIYDIPIALITRQYLDTLELMKELNLEVAGEFLVMAATLIHIKSRMLLPPDEKEGEGEEQDDPRAELVERLLEYQRFKEVSGELRERESLWRDVYSRPPLEEGDLPLDPDDPGEDPLYLDFSLFDLLTAFRRILERAPLEVEEITKETLTVKDRIRFIVEQLEGRENLAFESLFEPAWTKRELIVTFLALLEVLRIGLARVYQPQAMGAIWLVAPRPSDELGAVSPG